MEQKRFSVYEALTFGIKAFIDNIRLFVLAYFLVLGAIIPTFIVLGLFNVALLRDVSEMVHAKMHMASSEPGMAVGNITFAKELMTKFLDYKQILSIGLSLVALMFVFSGIGAGYAGVYLDLYDTGVSKPTRIFGFFKRSLKVFLAYVLYGSACLAGLILFVVPGVYLALRWSLFVFFIVDRNAGAVQALRLSWHATRGQVWQLFGITLVGMVIAKLGWLAFLLSPITGLAYVYIYRTLSKETSGL